MRKYRKDFAAILNASSSGMTKSRFLRLFFMSVTLIILGLPVQGYVLYQNTATYSLEPYSWSRVHGPQWRRIILIPTRGTVPFDRWIQLAVCFTVFIFFGLGHDAMKMYRQWLVKLGLAKIFPSLDRSRSQTDSSRPESDTSSFGSRARIFIKEKLKVSRHSWSNAR